MEQPTGVEIGMQSHAVYPFTVSLVHGAVKGSRRIRWSECSTKEKAAKKQAELMERFGVPGWSTPAAAA